MSNPVTYIYGNYLHFSFTYLAYAHPSLIAARPRGPMGHSPLAFSLLKLLLLAAAADAWVCPPAHPRYRSQPPCWGASCGSTLEGQPCPLSSPAASQSAQVTTGVNVFYSDKLLEHKVRSIKPELLGPPRWIFELNLTHSHVHRGRWAGTTHLSAFLFQVKGYHPENGFRVSIPARVLADVEVRCV